MADPSGAPDVWVTLNPWPGMASRVATLGGGDEPFPTHGGRRPRALFVAVGRAARWTCWPRTAARITWRCVGDIAGQPWATSVATRPGG